MFCCRLLIFFKIIFFEKFFWEYTIRVSNNLDPDQARHSVRPDLGSNCLQRLSVDNTSRQRVSIKETEGANIQSDKAISASSYEKRALSHRQPANTMPCNIPTYVPINQHEQSRFCISSVRSQNLVTLNFTKTTFCQCGNTKRMAHILLNSCSSRPIRTPLKSITHASKYRIYENIYYFGANLPKYEVLP